MAIKPELTSGALGLDGDLNKKTNPFLPSQEMYEFNGWYLTEAGAVAKRKGFTTLNDTVLLESGNPAEVVGLWDFVPSAGTTKKVMMTVNGLYTWNTPGADVWNAITTVPTRGGTATKDDLYDAAILLDQMYIGNGVDENIRFDANDGSFATGAYDMGMDGPTVELSASAGAGTSELSTGDYLYKYVFVNQWGEESNGSPTMTAPVSVTATDDVTLTGFEPPTPNCGITHYRIYRTTVDGAIYLRLGNDITTADMATASYTYIDTGTLSADTDLTVAMGSGFGKPPIFSMIEIFRGRAFMAGDPDNLSRVWFSAEGIPANVDSADFRDLDVNDGDILTGLRRFQNTIVAFKNNSIWNGYGEDRQTFGFERRVTQVGSVNNASIVEIPNRNQLIFLSQNSRFYFYDGTSVELTANEIEPILNGLNYNRLFKVVGCAVPKYNQIRWIVPNGGSTECDMVIWFDYVLNKWGTFDISNVPANYCTAMRESATNRQVAFFTGGITGYVWMGDSGGADMSTNAVANNIECSIMDRGHPKGNDSVETQKCFYHLFVWFTPLQVGTTVTVRAYLDDPDGSTYTTLGTFDCTNPSGQEHLHFNLIGRRIYFKFIESSTIEGLTLRGWKCYYKDLGRHNAP